MLPRWVGVVPGGGSSIWSVNLSAAQRGWAARAGWGGFATGSASIDIPIRDWPRSVSANSFYLPQGARQGSSGSAWRGWTFTIRRSPHPRPLSRFAGEGSSSRFALSPAGSVVWHPRRRSLGCPRCRSRCVPFRRERQRRPTSGKAAGPGPDAGPHASSARPGACEW